MEKAQESRGIRIFLIEENPDDVLSLKELLRKEKDLVLMGSCRPKEQALQKAQELRPDLVLMDMDPRSGASEQIALSRQLRIQTDAKIMILTPATAPEIILQAARESFASGYIFKNQSSLAVENIRALARGCTAQEYLIASAALSVLSDTELAVFYIMMGQENRYHSSPKTLANQKSTVLRKLGLKNLAELRHVFRMFLDQPGGQNQMTVDPE